MTTFMSLHVVRSRAQALWSQPADELGTLRIFIVIVIYDACRNSAGFSCECLAN